MKTTLEIPDDLFREAKAKAALEGIKLKDLVAESLRLRLATDAMVPTAQGQKVRLPLVPSRRPGTVKLTNAVIADFEAGLDVGGHE